MYNTATTTTTTATTTLKVQWTGRQVNVTTAGPDAGAEAARAVLKTVMNQAWVNAGMYPAPRSFRALHMEDPATETITRSWRFGKGYAITPREAYAAVLAAAKRLNVPVTDVTVHA